MGGWTTASRPASLSADYEFDDTVAAALLAVVQPAAIQAAKDAEEQVAARRDEAREALCRDLEAARYAAGRAFRQYDAADPENRLVTGELEQRWNRALERVAEIEARIAEHDQAAATSTPATLSFDALADDLQAVWSAPVRMRAAQADRAHRHPRGRRRYRQ